MGYAARQNKSKNKSNVNVRVVDVLATWMRHDGWNISEASDERGEYTIRGNAADVAKAMAEVMKTHGDIVHGIVRVLNEAKDVK